MKNLALDVESIALALSEEGGYEYYHIDDDLKELAKNVSDMQDENAKLREIITYLEDMLPKSERLYIHETVKAIAEDNSKLRKLLLDVWNDACQFDGFWDYVNDDGEIYNEDELPHYQERMRELGIEVVE